MTVEFCYLDFGKVFHSVNCRMSLRKITYFEITLTLTREIEVFLTVRLFRVVVDGSRSNTALLTSGVTRALSMTLRSSCYK